MPAATPIIDAGFDRIIVPGHDITHMEKLTKEGAFAGTFK